MRIKYIKAKDTDIEFLVQLRKETMTDHLEKAALVLSEEEHVARVKINFDGAFILQLFNERVGMLKYVENENEIEIVQLQIVPKHQGKGIGKQVMFRMISKARSFNKNLVLKVLKENPAKHLYERCGFHIIDEDDYEFYMERTPTTINPRI